jgi:hypothetical protein
VTTELDDAALDRHHSGHMMRAGLDGAATMNGRARRASAKIGDVRDSAGYGGLSGVKMRRRLPAVNA